MKFTWALFLTLLTSAQAATIAIIDSGIDYLHQDLAPHMWSNTFDDGEYGQVMNGWNFVTNQNIIFDYQLLDSYPSNLEKYYFLRELSLQGSISSDDRVVYNNLRKDSELKENVSQFDTLVHGTHVAGIAIANSNHQIFGITYIPSLPGSDYKGPKSLEDINTDEVFLALLNKNAEIQTAKFSKVTHFLSIYKAEIANGSFGAPYGNVKTMISRFFLQVYKRNASDEELLKSVTTYQNLIIDKYKKSLAKVSDTLFVFAAGNDGLNNDQFIFMPSSVGADNSISVAATDGEKSIAKFSNYGIKSVDVAAPGVNILSAVPRFGRLTYSGTSQATPFVSRIAGIIKDINPQLTPSQVKEILMRTVDKKSFLKDLVKSGGIVNEARALRAAELSKSLKLDQALDHSLAEDS